MFRIVKEEMTVKHGFWFQCTLGKFKKSAGKFQLEESWKIVKKIGILKNLDTLHLYINIVLGRTRFQTPNKSSVPFWRVCQSASSFFWLPNVTQVPDGWIPNPQHIVDTLTVRGFCTITCWIISIMIIGNNRNSHNNRTPTFGIGVTNKGCRAR